MLYQVTCMTFKCLAALCLGLLICNAECGGLFSRMKFEWRQVKLDRMKRRESKLIISIGLLGCHHMLRGCKADTLPCASRQRSAVAINDHMQAPCDRTKLGRAKRGVSQLWLFCTTIEPTSSLAEPARSRLQIPHLDGSLPLVRSSIWRPGVCLGLLRWVQQITAPAPGGLYAIRDKYGVFGLRKHRNRLNVLDNLVPNERRIPLGSAFLQSVWAKEANDVGVFPPCSSRWRAGMVLDFPYDPESRILEYSVIVEISRKPFRLH